MKKNFFHKKNFKNNNYFLNITLKNDEHAHLTDMPQKNFIVKSMIIF